MKAARPIEEGEPITICKVTDIDIGMSDIVIGIGIGIDIDIAIGMVLHWYGEAD